MNYTALFKPAISPYLTAREYGLAVMYLGEMTKGMAEAEIRKLIHWDNPPK